MTLIRSRPWTLAVLNLLPLLGWWAAFQPGFFSPDSIDQFTQIAERRFGGVHPPAHTLLLSVLTGGGRYPGAVGFVQCMLLTVLLMYGARLAMTLGVRTSLALAPTFLIGLAPAVGQTVNSVWKDVPFALAFLWAFLELVGLAAKRTTWRWIRLGVALSGVALFRQNGTLTVALMLGLLLWFYRREVRRPIVAVATTALIFTLVTGPIYRLAGAVNQPTEPATVFLGELAGSYNQEPESFTSQDLALMTELAPLDVWRSDYTCYETTPLIFDPRFDLAEAARLGPELRSLELRVLTRDPDSVAEHRACAASFLVVPFQPQDAYFHRPPYAMPENGLGLVRRPLSDLLFQVFDRVFRWAENDRLLWLTWRPAIVVVPGLVTAMYLLARRRVLAPAVLLYLVHFANVAATSPSQEFRYAFPLYLVAPLMWPLAGRVLTSSDRPPGDGSEV